MPITTINLTKGFKIQFLTPESEYTISMIHSPDSLDPSVPRRITVSFNGTVPFNFILVNGRRIICVPEDNKVFIYEVEQCHMSSESTGCSKCGFLYDEKGMCPSCGDETVMELRMRGLGPSQPPPCLPEEWRIQKDGCSALSDFNCVLQECHGIHAGPKPSQYFEQSLLSPLPTCELPKGAYWDTCTCGKKFISGLSDNVDANYCSWECYGNR